MKGKQMGILQILTATEILVFCSIFCHLPISVTRRFVLGCIGLTID